MHQSVAKKKHEMSPKMKWKLAEWILIVYFLLYRRSQESVPLLVIAIFENSYQWWELFSVQAIESNPPLTIRIFD